MRPCNSSERSKFSFMTLQSPELKEFALAIVLFPVYLGEIWIRESVANNRTMLITMSVNSISIWYSFTSATSPLASRAFNPRKYNMLYRMGTWQEQPAVMPAAKTDAVPNAPEEVPAAILFFDNR